MLSLEDVALYGVDAILYVKDTISKIFGKVPPDRKVYDSAVRHTCIDHLTRECPACSGIRRPTAA
jgi:hypothetical protein